MVLLLGLVKVLLCLFWMSFLFFFFFVILLGLGVLYLLALFSLRYCAARVAFSTPTWRKPVSGRVGR